MAIALVRTENSIYLFDTKAKEFQRRPISQTGRTQGEEFNKIVAMGALDDGRWMPYTTVVFSPHPHFNHEGKNDGLYITFIDQTWVQTSPLTDDTMDTARALVAGAS